ncbi:MAG: dihydroorotase [Chloroflexi bacterium RBG_16_51_9]|nr:MAG: dihydroorotase [Chloroflexi bacterium RBG_16_51_9]
MKQLLIRGGRIIDPSQKKDEIGNILVSDGKIAWLGKGEAIPSQADYDVLLAEGLIVCPGFVDLHCHLRQPGFEDKETIATGAQAAARGGFTTVCCMPNTNPPLDNRETIEFVKAEAAKAGAVRVLSIGCVTKGRAGKELAPLSELFGVGVIGFSDDGSPVLSAGMMRQALETTMILGLPVIDHCEDTYLTEGGVMNWGSLAMSLGLKGMPAAAEEIIVARDVALAGMTGGWVHIAHVSTEESVNIIRRAKQVGVRVTAEVTPHHLTLTEEKVRVYDTNAKVNPPLRTEQDRLALIHGLKEGVIDIIATDHAPHTAAEKALGFDKAPSGISGLETALGSLMGLVHSGQIDLGLLISKLTSEPAKILGDREGRLGSLAVVATADITLFDPDKEWLVEPDKFASKGKNTPLAGSKLKGKVMATIYGGKVVYCDDSIKVEEVEEKEEAKL